MQIYIQASEIYKVYFDISQRVQYIFEIYLKYENKRARYTKFTLVFHSKCSIYSRFISNTKTNERDIQSLLWYFTASAVYIRDLSQI